MFAFFDKLWEGGIVLHILKMTSEGVAVEWLSKSRKNYWVKKVFVVLPADLRFYVAELVFQNLLFCGINYLEKLHSWRFELKGITAQVLLTTQHSRILTRYAKARWYCQWLKQFFRSERRRIVKEEIRGSEKGE